MTLTTEPTYHVEMEDPPRRDPLRTRLIATVALLALAVVGLAIWLNSETNNEDEAAAPVLSTEVEQLFSDYLGAWSNGDRLAFEQLVTSDFTNFLGLNQWLGDDIITYAESLNATQAGAAVDGEEWTIEQVGDPIVAREDPWFISVNETWTSPTFVYQGTASYVIEEHDGKLLVASHYWTGLQDYLDR